MTREQMAAWLDKLGECLRQADGREVTIEQGGVGAADLDVIAAYLRQSCATCQHADTRDTIDGWCFCAPPMHEPCYPFIGKGMPLDERCKGFTPREV